MTIKRDQILRINTFNLGFINVYPIDILLKIEQADFLEDELVLSVIPLPGKAQDPTFYLIETWFKNVYPTLDKTNSILKNPAAFQQLVSAPIAGALLWQG